jgi:large subunit ribosomal protein L3
MGGVRASERGLEVVEVDAERNLLLIRGSVPGPADATVEVRSESNILGESGDGEE